MLSVKIVLVGLRLSDELTVEVLSSGVAIEDDNASLASGDEDGVTATCVVETEGVASGGDGDSEGEGDEGEGVVRVSVNCRLCGVEEEDGEDGIGSVLIDPHPLPSHMHTTVALTTEVTVVTDSVHFG